MRSTLTNILLFFTRNIYANFWYNILIFSYSHHWDVIFQNFNFGQKFRQCVIDLWAKFRLLTKNFKTNFYFWLNFCFWRQFRFLPRRWLLTEFMIFDRNLNFRPKFKFSTKMSVLYKHVDYWPKLRSFIDFFFTNQNQ